MSYNMPQERKNKNRIADSYGTGKGGVHLQLVGCLNIYWTELAPGTGPRCVDTKEFSASEEYFNYQQVLCDPGITYPGKEHRFEFQSKLPSPLPENYEDELCLIEYYIEARVKHDHVEDHDTVDRKEFSIINPVDLNTVIIPDVMSPTGQETSQTLCCWCCTSLPISARLYIKHSGYTPGQKIKLFGAVENNTSRSIKRSYVKLVKQRVYYTPKKKRVETDELASVECGSIKPHKNLQINKVSLAIPCDYFYNVDACQIFQISYYLEMVIEPKGSKKMVVPAIEIVLGHVPLSRTTKTQPPHARIKINNQEVSEDNQSHVKRKSGSEKKSPRERRKVREQRVAPSEQTDTSDYIRKPEKADEDKTMANKLTEQMIQSSNWTVN